MKMFHHTHKHSITLGLLAAMLLGAVSVSATPTGYSIGLNFDATEPNAPGSLAVGDRAGVPDVRQRNWNNLADASGANAEIIVADNNDAATNTTVTVEWTSAGIWSNTGRGEENNGFPTGPDRVLMTGYLDTGNATTTAITIRSIPSDLTAAGYDLFIYAMGGVAGRGGGYRILNADTSAVIRDYKLGDTGTNPSTFIEDPGISHTDTGNYLVFRSLAAANITIEATTADGQGFGGTPRAPVNAVQLVKSAGLLTIGAISGTPIGFTVAVEDSLTTTLDTNSIVLSLNGTVLSNNAISVSKQGSISTITYANVANPLIAGQTNTVSITIKNNLGTAVSATLPVIVPQFATLNGDFAVTGTNQTGFNVRTIQLPSTASIANSSQEAELLLAGKIIDPSTGQPAVNVATATSPESGVINYSIAAPNPAGNFSSNNGFTDKPVPGIPGTEGALLNFAQEITTYLELKAGSYQMGVNSDDGFKVTAGPDPRDVLGTTLGEFSGGRAASDSLFHFVVPRDGLYPFRLIWQQGGGDGSVEWFTVLNGQKILINDTTNPNAVKAYRSVTSPARPFVRLASPIHGSNPVSVSAPITFEIQDAATIQVNTNSIALKVNGATVTPTSVTKAGGTTTVTYNRPGGLASSTRYNVELTYADTGAPALTRTAALVFTAERVANQLPPLLESNGQVVIEAENFDAQITRGGHTWIFGNSLAGFAGDGYMQALPDIDSGTPNDPATIPTTAAELNFKVRFNSTGTYYVWIRGYGASGSSDSVHLGIDGGTDPAAIETSIRITGFNTTFSWRRARQTPSTGDPTVAVSTAGEHVINLWMREDGQIVDRILLTTNATFVPAEPGPAENLRVGQVPPVVSIISPLSGTNLPAGNISITANASVTAGTVAKVEFFSNGTKIGESTTSPFTFQWTGVAEGRYVLTARATTSAGVNTLSTPVTVVVGRPQILYVNAAGGPNPSDQALIARLGNGGYNVISVTGPNSLTSDAAGRSLVIISATVTSGDVTSKFRDVPVPVLNWEQAVQDDMLMVDLTDASVRGTIGNQTSLEIVSPGHEMAAGLTGTVAVVPAPAEFSWGMPPATATVIGRLTDGTGHAGLYGYEKGALLSNGVLAAPARRVHVFLTDNTYLLLNADGQKLIDAAIGWAIGKPLGGPAPQISISRNGNQLTITWTNGGTLEASDRVDTGYTSTGDSDGSFTVDMSAAPRKFYRVKR
jgi:hypothetical protein